MASSAKKKVQDSKCSREFQASWAEEYGMINKGDKAVCVLCSGTVHGKPFQEGEFLKEAWLACAPSLFDDFDNKDKIIQRIKDVPLSRNTIKDRILKLAENVTDQQKNDIKSAPFISLCLDIDITKSARLSVFTRYCAGNIIKEELIAITSLLTTTKGTDICTAVRNSLAEKEIDLKKIVSVTTDGAPNMVGKKMVSYFFI
ncbi:general transcription factor II-I repeat domain-containing protein 2A [Trichonephila clavipes]|nr:general transcription factor II-I repeat domain-containing protein 2A [Trichonephila clavipes]